MRGSLVPIAMDSESLVLKTLNALTSLIFYKNLSYASKNPAMNMVYVLAPLSSDNPNTQRIPDCACCATFVSLNSCLKSP